MLKEKFEQAGHVVVEFEDVADIYVLNTCSVTNMSDRKTRQMISKAKKQNKDAIIVALGCSVESNKEDLEGFKDNVDIILGNHSKMDLLEVLDAFLQDRKTKVDIPDISKVKKYKEVGTLQKGYDLREAIKIEDGCDNFCSYCVIPYIRGRVRSRALASIKKEAENLVKNGVKELVLVGIEVASYGKDLEKTTLFDVLDTLDKIDGLERVRLSSMEPRFLSKDNIERLTKYTKLCPHFHLSMQSGNNEVLKRMNRKYTKELLLEVCMDLKKSFENPYLASDLIVGFPGETDEEFDDTVNTINKMGLTEIHVFKYSKRRYTRAAKMDGQVDGNIKKKRSEIILALSKKVNKEFLEKYVGQTVSVLFENYTKGMLTGFTPNYIKVKVKGDEKLCGTTQDVVITSLEKEAMQGTLV